MHARSLRSISLLLALAISLVAAPAQRSANSNSSYQALRTLTPGDDIVLVQNLELHRDAATITLRQGTVAFYAKVNGKVTGAVFKGDGHLHLIPPTPEERHNLAILTKSEQFDEDFDQLVIRFSDDTAAELHKAAVGGAGLDRTYGEIAQQAHSFQHTKLTDNTDLRLLEDVLSPAPGTFFQAQVHGKKNHTLFFTVDANGIDAVLPEQVTLMNYANDARAYFSSFRMKGSKGDPGTYRIEGEDLDTSIEKSGFLTGLATVHLVAQRDGVAVVPLLLYPTLRVSKVEDDKGNALDWVQEKKDEDADFGVVLAAPLKMGEKATLRITYGGKDVVTNEGGSNYYPVARTSWYPNSSSGLGNYATFHMLFHVPKGLEVLATGTKVNEKTEGKLTTSEWKTDEPMAVVGFNMGKFKTSQGVLKDGKGNEIKVEAYANTEVPDAYRAAAEGSSNMPMNNHQIQNEMPVGTLNTTRMLPVQLSQAQAAVQIYSGLFGPMPFKRIAVTQQFACNYGQSWPTLVYLPICGFLDSTQQHAFGLDPSDIYWKEVTPHEVAHQWWGQSVGFASYRDQWMSEGFADASAAMYLLATRPKANDYLEFWKDARRLITERNAMGFRPIDVGPVTMGVRLSTEKTGLGVYRRLVYPKGAYILHMIQSMMWTREDGDKRFIAMMHDFTATYRLKVATTEDFKAMVEKHMTSGMDLDNNHRMDWFFNQYVYGTALPNYHFEAQNTPTASGSKLHYKLVQSGVTAEFKNIVPIYLELADGRVLRLGNVNMHGNGTSEQDVLLPALPSPIKKISINANYDVLCTEN